jgi:hypothetical protein
VGKGLCDDEIIEEVQVTTRVEVSHVQEGQRRSCFWLAQDVIVHGDYVGKSGV